MDCEQAQQLFDAYLDGELSPSLATELGAHRVGCAECRRALALLEVTGHIIASDEDAVTLHESFSQRLLACTEFSTPRWTGRFRRGLYIAGPLAAAAVIALAFLGVFDGGLNQVAGERGEGTVTKNVSPVPAAQSETLPADSPSPEERELEAWIKRTRENWKKREQSGESLRQGLDLTVIQLLDILNEAKNRSEGVDHIPGADPKTPAPLEPAPPDSDDLEDVKQPQ